MVNAGISMFVFDTKIQNVKLRFSYRYRDNHIRYMLYIQGSEKMFLTGRELTDFFRLRYPVSLDNPGVYGGAPVSSDWKKVSQYSDSLDMAMVELLFNDDNTITLPSLPESGLNIPFLSGEPVYELEDEAQQIIRDLDSHFIAAKGSEVQSVIEAPLISPPSFIPIPAVDMPLPVTEEDDMDVEDLYEDDYGDLDEEDSTGADDELIEELESTLNPSPMVKKPTPQSNKRRRPGSMNAKEVEEGLKEGIHNLKKSNNREISQQAEMLEALHGQVNLLQKQVLENKDRVAYFADLQNETLFEQLNLLVSRPNDDRKILTDLEILRSSFKMHDRMWFDAYNHNVKELGIGDENTLIGTLDDIHEKYAVLVRGVIYARADDIYITEDDIDYIQKEAARQEKRLKKIRGFYEPDLKMSKVQ